jgi:RNA polymerase sigma-70 factor (ECF subfamily)
LRHQPAGSGVDSLTGASSSKIRSGPSENADAERRVDVEQRPGVRPDPGLTLLELYDVALPEVYGYLLSRCGQRALAEDLTEETFLAALAACRRPEPPGLSVPWLIGVARHKLVDHWRAVAREERGLRVVAGGLTEPDDPWDERLDAIVARQVLDTLAPHHRAALTLRYLDGLPVADVAKYLDRTLHATEALLVRARSAFRKSYPDHHDESEQEGRS